MLTRNSQDLRDLFALALVKEFGLTLRNLQIALERSAEGNLALDRVLVDMKVLPESALAMAAEKTDFVLTAEQPADIEVPNEGNRAFVRHGTSLAVNFTDWGNLKVAYANNISRGGLGITLPLDADPPTVGAVVGLSLALPDGNVLEVRGQVCYSREGDEHRHVGIQLHHDDTEQLLQIDRLLKALPT